VIVRLEGDRLGLIRQPDHAHLAGAIMERCVSLATHPRRFSILHAVAEHDNGWAEEDDAPLFDAASGGVSDFVTAPPAVRQRVWPRGIARLAPDPWAAALVAQHADTVYERFHENPDWTMFFVEVRGLRDGLVRETGLAFSDLAADYAYVRLGDLISLTFCTGWTDEHRFADVAVKQTRGRVVVTPDLFGNKVIPIEITARAISRLQFGSATELQDAWNAATTITLQGEVAATPHF
jgi:hypothetical protein